MTEEFTERELILLDTALTSFIQSRNHFFKELEPYHNLRNKVHKIIEEVKQK